MQNQDYNLATVVLPTGILEFFDLSKIFQTDESFHFYLEEKNNIPQEYINQQLTSKGFFEEIKVQDFPIRGKAVFLFIRRRRWRWVDKQGIIVFRDWELVAKGTRITKEFAAFLKVASRYEAGKL
jgi:hypothetical protein